MVGDRELSHKLWGGRFEKELAQEVVDFTFSVAIDGRLWPQDIAGSIAHARMLGKQGILSEAESNQIIKGLEAICADLKCGKLELDESAEDIHAFIEGELQNRIGAVAGKLHTGRSRNDQVATDTRMWTKEAIENLRSEIRSLQTALIEIADKHKRTVLPGLTHQQHAQPVSLGHHLLAYFWMLERDWERLGDTYKRTDMMPLGSAAMAGSGFPLDRQMTANELGFAAPAPNSMDAVSDRDFVVEFISACTLLMTHLSRLSQELINWSMPEFDFVTLDDAYTTGSSIMPQKKNPDVCELIRGRSARLLGNLTAIFALLKALPLAYNRDLQDDKPLLFESFDLTLPSVRLIKAMLETAAFHPSKMASATRGDYSTATDLADYLVRKGSTFREAHELVGRIVRDCIEKKRGLERLTLKELQTFSPLLDEGVLSLLKPITSMSSRTTEGGTAPSSVTAQIRQAKKALKISK